MSAKNNIPEMQSYEEIAEFWDSHSVADYWDETEPVKFEISPTARRKYLVAIDPAILQRLQKVAHERGLSTESIVNLFLEQHLASIHPA